MNTKDKIKKDNKQMVCDTCGCSFDEKDAIQGEDICYYYCSESCRRIAEDYNY